MSVFESCCLLGHLITSGTIPRPAPRLLLEQRVREASGEKASWDRALLELAGPRLGGLPGPPGWVGRLPGTPGAGLGSSPGCLASRPSITPCLTALGAYRRHPSPPESLTPGSIQQLLTEPSNSECSIIVMISPTYWLLSRTSGKTATSELQVLK